MEQVRQLPEVEKRVETGPVKFGDDWTGVFIRGDNCFGYVAQLRAVLLRPSRMVLSSHDRIVLGELLNLLESSNENSRY